ncbi:nitroreductase family protein [Paraburkholderia rhizosphaerae]|uniref:Nitroreductase n=1 Tax=Paraburkholderia rhizosphaerae TaxID=480658 RepID=A0A4R8LTB9_9BURK|nr:nitroreductase family protein [Paraburkholderia rhizosphaerae]TDY50950.1 nitroreductase [Paraburkholderia rhizosphaerae]
MTEIELLTYEPSPSAREVTPRSHAPAVIDLPQPDTDSGVSLMTALWTRASTREFADDRLTQGTLGGILWAANGVNRPATGGRTAPSAHAFREVDVYAVLEEGVYRYDAPGHRLVLKHAVDARNMTGYQDFVGTAPLDLVYVVCMSKLLEMAPQQRDIFAAVSAGAISQNVSLYCASAGLATVVRGWINHRLLANALSLNEDELPILAQTVGKRATVLTSLAD